MLLDKMSFGQKFFSANGIKQNVILTKGWHTFQTIVKSQSALTGVAFTTFHFLCNLPIRPIS
jgi:hypothetical protein